MNFINISKYIVFLLLLLSVSCTTTKYIEVPLVQTEIEYRNKILKDSIYVKDSTVIVIKGDTVYKYRDRYNTKYIYETDTILKTDSIPYPVYLEKTKEINKLYWWQSLLIYIGIATVTCFITWLFIKLKSIKLW